MSASIVASRYARALSRSIDHDVAKGKELLGELKSISELFEIEQSRKVLLSPVMPEDFKSQLLDYGLDAAKAGSEVRGFIGTIVESGRVDLFPQIVDRFTDILNNLSGKLTAQVTSAVELDGAAEGKLSDELGKLFEKEVEISKVVDPTILGGLVIKVGNSLIDLSVKSKLHTLTK